MIDLTSLEKKLVDDFKRRGDNVFSPEMLSNRRILQYIVEKGPSYITLLPPQIRRDESFYLDLDWSNPLLLDAFDFEPTLKKSKKVILKLLESLPPQYIYRVFNRHIIPDSLINSPFALQMIKANFNVYPSMTEIAEMSEEDTLTWIALLKSKNIQNFNSDFIAYIDDNLKGNSNVIEAWSDIDFKGAIAMIKGPALYDVILLTYLLKHKNITPKLGAELLVKLSTTILNLPEIKKHITPQIQQEIDRISNNPDYEGDYYDEDDDDDEDEEYEDEDYVGGDYDEEDEDYDTGFIVPEDTKVDKTVNIQQREKQYAYLFRKNIHKLALRLYKGNKKTVYALFNLYSNIVDIRSNTFSDTLKKGFNLWVGIVRDHSKQFTPDERIIKEIGLSLKAVENFLKNNPHIDLKKKIELYKNVRYHNLIKDLVSYMVSFFNHLGIKVKPLPIVSDVTGIKIIALTSDIKEEEEPLEEQLSVVNNIKNRMAEVFLSSLHINPEEDVEKQVKGIPYYETSEGFVSLETLDTYKSLGDLLEAVKKHQIIDQNYSSLVLNQGKIINPKNNKAIKAIKYFNPSSLKKSIDQYQEKLNAYNAKLKPYEKPLTNEPKTIQVGDHSFKVMKIAYLNIPRLVVIEGQYAGHYVDELVSTTGEVIGSASKASPYITDTSKGMKDLHLYHDTYGLKTITKNKPFETFKKLNGVKDSPISENIGSKLDPKYEKSLSYIVSLHEDILTKETLHKLTGLGVVSNIPQAQTENISISGDDSVIIHDFVFSGLLQINNVLYFENGKPDHIHNSLFRTEKCLPDGLGTRVFVQQTKTASEMGFKYIDLMAARGAGMVGYYVWPKLGYNTTIDLKGYMGRIQEKDIPKYEYLKKWLLKNGIEFKDTKISDIYACKAGERFIGQELWYKYGDGMNMKLDLTPGSLSMRILESYVNLKSKKDNIDPSEFLNINYSKYNALDLECYLDKGGEINTITEAIKHNIKNYENGVIEKLYRNPKTRDKFLSLLSEQEQSIINSVKEILEFRRFENVRLASEGQLSDDPILKELDMGILDQIWSGISRQYKQ